MKPYVITTGILFLLIAGAHVFEMIDRGHVEAGDAVVLVLSTGLAVWAWRLFRRVQG